MKADRQPARKLLPLQPSTLPKGSRASRKEDARGKQLEHKLQPPNKQTRASTNMLLKCRKSPQTCICTYIDTYICMHAKCVRTCLFTFWVSEFLVTILRVVAGCRTEQGNAKERRVKQNENEIAMLSENFPNLAPNQRVSAVGKHNKTDGLSQEEQNKKKEGRPRCDAQTSDPAHSGYCARIPLKLNPHNQREKGKRQARSQAQAPGDPAHSGRRDPASSS